MWTIIFKMYTTQPDYSKYVFKRLDKYKNCCKLQKSTVYINYQCIAVHWAEGLNFRSNKFN